MRVFTSYLCDPGVIPRPGITCGWSLLLILMHPCSSGLCPGPLDFLPLQKPLFQISILPGNNGEEEPPCGLFTANKKSYYCY